MSIQRLVANPAVTDILKGVILNNKNKLVGIERQSPGHTFEDLLSSKRPTKNRDYSPISGGIHLCDFSTDASICQATDVLGASECTNAFVYPPGSIMGWHTNNDIVGTRVYYTFTIKRGAFRYYNSSTKRYVIDEDDIGWTCRQFTIDPHKPLWHTVWAEGVRFAFGFNYVSPTMATKKTTVSSQN